MKKIFIVLLAISFLFSLGKREDREFDIYEIDFNDEIKGTEKWSHSLYGGWSSSSASIPKMNAYRIRGYDNYLILDITVQNIATSKHDLFILDMSKISSSIFPLKEEVLETIAIPYIILHSSFLSKSDLKIADMMIENIVSGIFSQTDELPSTNHALYIDYYNYKDDNGAQRIQYAIRYDDIGIYGDLLNYASEEGDLKEINNLKTNTVYTAGELRHGHVSEEMLTEMFLYDYYEASHESFYQFLHDFLSPYLKYQGEDWGEESEIDTLDFMDTGIEGFDDWKTPSQPKKENNRPKWVQYDQAPKPKKQIKPKYPNVCRQAGIEGTVVISFWVDEKGDVDLESIEVLQSIPCLDQVCIDAIKKSKWNPAKQGKEKVGVPLSMPINFKL